MTKTATEVLRELKNFCTRNSLIDYDCKDGYFIDAGLLENEIIRLIKNLKQPESAEWQVGDRFALAGLVYRIVKKLEDGNFYAEPLVPNIRNGEVIGNKDYLHARIGVGK